MKLAVIGSRAFADVELLERTLDQLRFTCLISGGSQGADRVAESYARARGIPVEIFKPDWRMGRGAGPARNTQIIEACEHVVAFWDGTSKGTKDAISKARAKGRPVVVIEFVPGKAE